MPICAQCGVYACHSGKLDALPKNCPSRDEAFMQETVKEYATEENSQFFREASGVEKVGYCRWPRLKETLEFCRRLGYTKVGMAFCAGLRQEAKVIAKLFADYGIELHSVICKTGSLPKQEAGIPDEYIIRPGTRESICNPIAQAKLLNQSNTQLNIVVGLCVGHDSLFYKYSDAPVTTLIVKDRALGNNPAAAVYCADGYMKQRLSPEAE